jgi:hypothetical protein
MPHPKSNSNGSLLVSPDIRGIVSQKSTPLASRDDQGSGSRPNHRTWLRQEGVQSKSSSRQRGVWIKVARRSTQNLFSTVSTRQNRGAKFVAR